jgi:hypothetical protein
MEDPFHSPCTPITITAVCECDILKSVIRKPTFQEKLAAFIFKVHDEGSTFS